MTVPVNSELPEFVRRRMEVVYLRRVREDWGGQHLFRGRHPGSGAIRLDTNDYLDLTAAPERERVTRLSRKDYRCWRIVQSFEE